MVKTEEMVEQQAPKAHVAIRCAKASIMLSTLKNLLNSTNHHQLQKDEEIEEVEMLKIEVVKEKMKNKKIKICSVMNMFLEIMVLLSFSTLCLLLVVFIVLDSDEF